MSAQSNIFGMGTGMERGISLTKITDTDPTPSTTPRTRVRHPYYPLVGHRNGLRANDPVSLASAFWILAIEGGTAHMVGPRNPRRA